MIINSKPELRQYVRNKLQSTIKPARRRTTRFTPEEVAFRVAEHIWWMNRPRCGKDWSDFLNDLDDAMIWDELVEEVTR
jgi:hypothetical protein